MCGLVYHKVWNSCIQFKAVIHEQMMTYKQYLACMSVCWLFVYYLSTSVSILILWNIKEKNKNYINVCISNCLDLTQLQLMYPVLVNYFKTCLYIS